MKYVSTRGQAPVLEFGDVLLAGLATDGGLYVPDEWPRRSPSSASTPPTSTPAVAVMAPYVAPSHRRGRRFRAMVTEAYATFDHPDVCPVRPIDDGLWLLELFWGPTIAFKDVALQLVGRLFDHELTQRGRAGHHRRGHLGRHRLGGHRGLPRPARASTSWCCTPPGGSATSSASR